MDIARSREEQISSNSNMSANSWDKCAFLRTTVMRMSTISNGYTHKFMSSISIKLSVTLVCSYKFIASAEM